MKIAYLCNLYPAVSHSFIRREIAALEAEGHQVDRYSIRSASRDLPDPMDCREAETTIAVLAQSRARLLWDFAATCLARPKKAFSAAQLAVRSAGFDAARLVRHVAYLVEACWLVRRFDDHPVDHLHAHFGTNPAMVARLARRLGGPAYSFTVHGPDEFDAPQALGLAGKVADAAFVVAISDYGRAQLMRWSRVEDWDRIAVVRCGLDALFLAQDEPARVREDRILVCVARLSGQKGLPLLIEAAAALREEGEAFKLRILGGGDLRPLLERAIAAQRLDDIVTLAGSCDAATVRAHLLAARALVLPSFAEGLPVVIMEALALQRPVIATAVAGIPELVDRECGWLIPAGSREALVGAMKEALSASPPQLAAMGAEGRKRVLERHDIGHNARRLAELVERSVRQEARAPEPKAAGVPLALAEATPPGPD